MHTHHALTDSLPRYKHRGWKPHQSQDMHSLAVDCCCTSVAARIDVDAAAEHTAHLSYNAAAMASPESLRLNPKAHNRGLTCVRAQAHLQHMLTLHLPAAGSAAALRPGRCSSATLAGPLLLQRPDASPLPCVLLLLPGGLLAGLRAQWGLQHSNRSSSMPQNAQNQPRRWLV